MPVAAPIHNPVQYMDDLRLALSQGRKRLGLLIGAGVPTAIHVDDCNRLVDTGQPLVPDSAGLTKAVIGAMSCASRQVVETLVRDMSSSGSAVNIETILTQVRMLGQAIGEAKIHGLKGREYDELGKRICVYIGERVRARLPLSPNPYTELVSWVSGTQREHAVEIFTPNYDLLLEEAFERAQVPYFDGFSGAHRPFFDAASVLVDMTSAPQDQFPARWSRIWKLHGSLGWEVLDGVVVRTGQREATELIYPDHLKYDQVTKLPYVALFDRLRQFLTTPDTLLICSGFSFLDSHICAVLDESLAANRHTAILAFQFRSLDAEQAAARLAYRRPNMSVYARNGAIINGVAGEWQPGELPTDDWLTIRHTFWSDGSEHEPPAFLLGDFGSLARFLALTHSQRLSPRESQETNTDPMAAAGA